MGKASDKLTSKRMYQGGPTIMISTERHVSIGLKAEKETKLPL